MEFFKRTPRIPFMALRRWTYGVSAVLILGSLALLFTRGLNFGIDFTGGVVVEVSFPGAVDLNRARTALADAGFADAQVQSFGSSRDIAVRVPPPEGKDNAQVAELTNRASAEIERALKTIDPGAQMRRTEVVGPQVGKDLSEQGSLAMLFTFIMITLYVAFRFEKKMALGTVLGAMHDPLVILGFFAATQMTFDLAVLAAILAVIGYSINDTVVVFDRVREVFVSTRKGTPTQMMDGAINQTLSRTLMTSFSTLFVVVSLYLFGGETLKGFALAIIIGVIVGTYSSIFVAGALALDLKLKPEDLMPPKKVAEVDDLP